MRTSGTAQGRPLTAATGPSTRPSTSTGPVSGPAKDHRHKVPPASGGRPRATTEAQPDDAPTAEPNAVGSGNCSTDRTWFDPDTTCQSHPASAFPATKTWTTSAPTPSGSNRNRATMSAREPTTV